MLTTVPEKPPILLEGHELTHIKTRPLTGVSIYKNENIVARYGSKFLIQEELCIHKLLLQFKFPVAKILSEGEKDSEYYYLEESVGEVLLGKVFQNDTKTHGEIVEENFNDFLNLVKNYATALMDSVGKLELPATNFREGIQLGDFTEELPHLQELAEQVVTKIESRLSIFPTVFNQGDFNPHNMFPQGVIDFDAAFAAPLGYDLVTAIFHTYSFSKENLDNYYRAYQFNQEQEERYLTMVDQIFTDWGYPPPSEYIDDFVLARYIWSAVHMGDYPNVQKWRYAKLERMMRAYMNNESVLSIHKE